ncbi:hypothetical protein VaNZ11_000552, partial [Volvox africanus]
REMTNYVSHATSFLSTLEVAAIRCWLAFLGWSVTLNFHTIKAQLKMDPEPVRDRIFKTGGHGLPISRRAFLTDPAALAIFHAVNNGTMDPSTLPSHLRTLADIRPQPAENAAMRNQHRCSWLRGRQQVLQRPPRRQQVLQR